MRDKKDVEEHSLLTFRKIVQSCKKCSGLDNECVCRLKHQIARAAYEACIPAGFKNLKKSDVKSNRDLFEEIVLKYVENLKTALYEGYGLFFIGDNNSGKTTFISYILMTAIRAGRTVYYTTESQLEHDIKSGWKFPENQKRLDWLLTSDFLAIDEVGKKKDRSLINYEVDRLIKMRCDNNDPAILASNKNLRELNRIYGPTFNKIIDKKYKVVTLQPVSMKDAPKKMKRKMGY